MSYSSWKCVRCGWSPESIGMGCPPSKCKNCGEEYELVGVLQGVHMCHDISVQRSKSTGKVFTETPLGLSRIAGQRVQFVPVEEQSSAYQEWAKDAHGWVKPNVTPTWELLMKENEKE